MQVIPWWLRNKPECWEMMVDKWLTEEWEARHYANREARLKMPGIPHHQGSRHLGQFAAAWVRELNPYFIGLMFFIY